MPERQKIAVDLDGTLAHYESGQYPEIGDPVEPMMARVHKWIEEGHEVIIFTARASNGDRDIKLVKAWLNKHGIGDLEVTATKTTDIDVFWDDKAVQVIPNTGKCVANEEYQESCATKLPAIKGHDGTHPLDLFRELENDG